MPALAPLLCEFVAGGDGQDVITSRHGSVLVGEQGQAGDRLIVPLLSEHASDPRTLYGDGVARARHAGLIMGGMLATCPHGLAGGEVGCH